MTFRFFLQRGLVRTLQKIVPGFQFRDPLWRRVLAEGPERFSRLAALSTAELTGLATALLFLLPSN